MPLNTKNILKKQPKIKLFISKHNEKHQNIFHSEKDLNKYSKLQKSLNNCRQMQCFHLLDSTTFVQTAATCKPLWLLQATLL